MSAMEPPRSATRHRAIHNTKTGANCGLCEPVFGGCLACADLEFAGDCNSGVVSDTSSPGAAFEECEIWLAGMTRLMLVG